MSSATNANTARGLKAAIHNPNVSETAKEHAADRLQQMGEEVPADFAGATQHHVDDTHSTRVLAGYKATLKNPNVSEEAKNHAAHVLEDHNAEIANVTDDHDKHSNRVLGGYKAALKNPNVSEQAKEHAAEILNESGV